MQQLHFNPAGVTQMSNETQAKGEAFIQALIDEGHSYESMKAGFLTCAMRRGLRLGKGEVGRAAKVLKAHRNTLWKLDKLLGMGSFREQLKAEAAAAK